jgi:hypothetical protein
VDYPIVKDYRWCPVVKPKKSRTIYAQAGFGPRKNHKKIRMHRLLLFGLNSSSESDHVNHDGVDNRKRNLRPATRCQNSQNQPKTKNSYKGVFLCPSGKFKAVINANHKQIRLGSFDLPEDAARAYNQAALKHHGEFAVLNYLDDASTLVLDGYYINGPLRGKKAEGEKRGN